jgi:hypothetical protein
MSHFLLDYRKGKILSFRLKIEDVGCRSVTYSLYYVMLLGCWDELLKAFFSILIWHICITTNRDDKTLLNRLSYWSFKIPLCLLICDTIVTFLLKTLILKWAYIFCFKVFSIGTTISWRRQSNKWSNASLNQQQNILGFFLILKDDSEFSQ